MSQPKNKIWADQPGLGSDKLEFEVEGRTRKASAGWYRGEVCNFHPDLRALRGESAGLDHVLKGWLPAEPIIGQRTRLAAFGSCFAANISNWLNARKYTVVTSDNAVSSYVVQFSDAMVTTFSILQQFEWALEDKEFTQNLWHGKDKRAHDYDARVKAETRDLFLRSDVFIVTLGLSEIWYDAITGEVFWRAVPRDEVDPARHKFRVSTVEENRQNLVRICELIRKHRPEAKVIFTLSPIPLTATFRPVSCITANSVSKAILRVAIDEALADVNAADGSGDGSEIAFYWPSYEIVTELFGAGKWKKDRRHVKEEVLAFIMVLFETVWCVGSVPEKSLLQAWVDAKCADGSIPVRVSRLVQRRDFGKLRRVVEKIKAKDPDMGGLLERWLLEIDNA